MLKGEDVVRFIKSQRRWFGVCRENGRQCNAEENVKRKTALQKKERKTRMRWLEDVESDLKKMEVKGWKEKMRDREQWRLVVEGAKAHPVL
jgi:hypothetical protein